jgi:hypothetical protein
VRVHVTRNREFLCFWLLTTHTCRSLICSNLFCGCNKESSEEVSHINSMLLAVRSKKAFPTLVIYFNLVLTHMSTSVASTECEAPVLRRRMPCLYVNHGGGPMPLLGQQPAVGECLIQSKAIENPIYIRIFQPNFFKITQRHFRKFHPQF